MKRRLGPKPKQKQQPIVSNIGDVLPLGGSKKKRGRPRKDAALLAGEIDPEDLDIRIVGDASGRLKFERDG